MRGRVAGLRRSGAVAPRTARSCRLTERVAYLTTGGALPEVEPADIDRDLLRRDATINAIAVPLAGGVLVAAAMAALEASPPWPSR
mgnify:CR=1 FL=1